MGNSGSLIGDRLNRNCQLKTSAANPTFYYTLLIFEGKFHNLENILLAFEEMKRSILSTWTGSRDKQLVKHTS